MAKILPIASGKGGVGKTFFSTNLGIVMSEMGQKVALVDLDLGGSNLHTMLGIKNNLEGIGHYIYDTEIKFEKIVHKTEFENLSFIPGDALFLSTANLPFFRKIKIIKELKNLDVDWVIIDLGSGTSANTLDFFLASNSGVLVTTPDITAILNLYSFVKNAYYRFIVHHYKKRDPLREKIAKDIKLRFESDSILFTDYLEELKKDFPEEEVKLGEIINNFFPRIVINNGNNTTDVNLGENLRKIIKKNLNLDTEYLGLLPEEVNAHQCILERTPLYKFDKNSNWIKSCEKIADRLINAVNFPFSIFEEDVDSLQVILSDLNL